MQTAPEVCSFPIVSQQDIIYLQSALRTLNVQKIPETGNLYSLKRDLCQLVRAQQASVVGDQGPCLDSIPPGHRIRIKIDQKIECYDVLELYKRITETPWKHRFSTSQVARIKRQVEILDLPLPRSCHQASGMKEICVTNPDCHYNERTMLGAFFSTESSKYAEGECYPKHSHIKALLQNCEEAKSESIITVLMDMVHRAFLLQHLPVEMDTDTALQIMSQLHDMMPNIRRELQQKEHQQLCLLLQENSDWYLSHTYSWYSSETRDQVSTLKQHLQSGESFLRLLNANYVSLQLIEQLVSSLKMIPVDLSTYIQTIHFAVNGAIWVYSTFFASYAAFYFLTPGGWMILKQYKDNPNVLSAVGILLSLFLDDTSVAVDMMKQLSLSAQELHVFTTSLATWQKLIMGQVTSQVAVKGVRKKISRKP